MTIGLVYGLNFACMTTWTVVWTNWEIHAGRLHCNDLSLSHWWNRYT